jgi:hypothetical protein
LTVRLYFLKYFTSSFAGNSLPKDSPDWMIRSKLKYLQPSTFEIAYTNIDVDDSRWRKISGYKNSFTTIQSLRWVCDACRTEIEMGMYEEDSVWTRHSFSDDGKTKRFVFK